MSVVPDSIEPVEGWRCWNFGRDGLHSLTNSAHWPAGEELAATCVDGHRSRARSYHWEVVRNGMSIEQCEARARMMDEWNEARRGFLMTPAGLGVYPAFHSVPTPPSTVLSPGYDYALIEEVNAHDCPDENCSCGIYAADNLTGVPTTGQVYGKVKLWGKVIPGERGWRAQYAYPSELYAPPKLMEHPALLAYGVPIHQMAEEHDEPRPRSMPWSLQIAIGANLGMALVNLTLLLHVLT